MLALSIHYSNATQDMIEDDIRKQIQDWSRHYELDENVVKAIIKTESSYQPWAIRIENHLKITPWYTNVLPEKYMSNEYAYCSMGLMQILFGVAVDYGFGGSPIELMQPENAIKYGCRHLANLKKRFPNGNDYIAAYNQGNNRRVDSNNANSPYQNQQYVDKVLKNLATLQAED